MDAQKITAAHDARLRARIAAAGVSVAACHAAAALDARDYYAAEGWLVAVGA